MARGDYPSKDGLFRGQKYECAICGVTYRRYEMVRQRGKLVCKISCHDASQNQWVGTEKRKGG